jgi:hypothetical protein
MGAAFWCVGSWPGAMAEMHGVLGPSVQDEDEESSAAALTAAMSSVAVFLVATKVLGKTTRATLTRSRAPLHAAGIRSDFWDLFP